MTTALDLIKGAMKLNGVLFKNDDPASDEANDGLIQLNDMLASWSNNGLLIVSRVLETFSITAASSYTIGTGQTINTERPLNIVAAYVTIAGEDYNLDIITDEEFASISTKTLATNYPEVLNYNNGYPTGTIKLWPLVSTSTQLTLLSEKQITSLPLLTTTVSLPPGWNRAIKANLAVDQAAQYGVSVTPELARMASDSLNDIELSIAKNRPITFVRNIPTNRFFNGYFR